MVGGENNVAGGGSGKQQGERDRHSRWREALVCWRESVVGCLIVNYSTYGNLKWVFCFCKTIRSVPLIYEYENENRVSFSFL